MRDEDKKFIREHRHDLPVAKIATSLGLREAKVRKFLRKEGAVARRESPPDQVYPIRWLAICVALIVAAGCLVYANALSGAFIWDDELLVRDNIFVKSWWPHLRAIFSSSVSQGTAEKFIVYRPLQILTYALDYHFWRLNPWGYHLTNLFWHLAAALGVFWLMTLLFNRLGLSLATALLFVTHPVHTGAVSYISGRADPLAFTLILLTFIFYLKASECHRPHVFAAMAIFYVAALLSRETSLVLPFLILAMHFSLKRSSYPRALAALFLLAGAYVILRVTVFKSFLRDEAYMISLAERLPGVFVALLGYARLLLWPFGLHMQYGQRLFLYTDPAFFLGVFLWAFLILLAWFRRQKDPVVCFGIAWFLIAWVPVSNFFPLNAYMAEHWLYVPSVGFFLVAGDLFARGLQKKTARPAALAALSAALFFYGVLTIRQNAYWRNPQIFFERTLVFAPQSPRILRNLAKIYQEKGRFEEAVALYQRAIRVTPEEPELFIDIGGVYEKMGRSDEVRRAYGQALFLYEKEAARGEVNAVTHNNLGFLYVKAGDLSRAQLAFEKAIAMDPHFVDAHNNLNAIAQRQQSPQEVIAFYEKAGGLDPASPEACYNLALAYQQSGRREEALRLYEKALVLNPDYARAHAALGGLQLAMGRVAAAQASYGKALSAAPDDENIVFSAGLGYQKMGRAQEAMACYKKVIALNPDSARAHANLGAVYYAAGRIQEAFSAWQEAVRLDPQAGEVRANLGVAYFQAGRYQEARASLLEAIEKSPRFLPAYAHLILVDRKLGLAPEAKETLQKALEIDPSFETTFKELLSGA